MTAWFVTPLLVAIIAAVATAFVAPKYWPRMAAALLTGVALLAAVVWVGLSMAIAGAYVVEHTPLQDVLAWCPALSDHHVTHWFGVSACASAAVSLANISRWAVSQRRLASLVPSFDTPLVVTDTDRPCAYAVPGSPGTVVVSKGMLRRLDPSARRALLAHEQAHLRHGHHRIVAAATFATMALPVLWPLRSAIWLAVESWADEEAVRAVGSRRVVANAIAKAGIIQSEFPTPAGQLAMADYSVGSRVQRLLTKPVGRVRMVSSAALVGVPFLVTLLGTGMQLSYITAFARHVCS
jgi:Zn-dependent protease with chaperone function